VPCPSCGEPTRSIAWGEVETITVEDAPRNCGAALHWGECQNCCEEVYLLEIGIVAGRSKEQFIMDYGRKEHQLRLYSMGSRALPMPWMLVECRDNAGVTMTDAEHRLTLRNIPLIDIHVLGGWSAGDRNAAFVKARGLARELIATFGGNCADH
jgi:hypothetical protein